MYQDASDYANQSRTSNHEEGSRTKKYSEEEKNPKDDHGKILEELAKGLNSNSSLYDEEVRRYNKADPRQDEELMREAYLFEFYVDAYSDEKIKEIISIFRNDFKPPKNLWIENMNIQNTAEANYFNDVFADDDNYSESLENSPEADTSHNEEIDDIGYQISEQKKEKPKPEELKELKEVEEVKEIKEPKKEKPKEPEPKEESKYTDRIKPIEDEKKKEKSAKEKEQRLSPKEETKDHEQKSLKPKKKNQGPTDYKVKKAENALNIIIPDSRNDQSTLDDIPGIGEVGHIDDLNKTRKLPKNFTDNFGMESPHDKSDNQSNISIGKCKDEIDQKLKLIEKEKEKLELERQHKKKHPDKKSSKSKNRSGAKSTREGYHKKKRPNSHKKRGSTSNMHEQLKKKMGFINSHSSRGRGRDQFLNYSLDEINQKLQAKAKHYNTSTGKGKKRLNKSFENVFSS